MCFCKALKFNKNAHFLKCTFFHPQNREQLLIPYNTHTSKLFLFGILIYKYEYITFLAFYTIITKPFSLPDLYFFWQPFRMACEADQNGGDFLKKSTKEKICISFSFLSSLQTYRTYITQTMFVLHDEKGDLTGYYTAWLHMVYWMLWHIKANHPLCWVQFFVKIIIYYNFLVVVVEVVRVGVCPW